MALIAGTARVLLLDDEPVWQRALARRVRRLAPRASVLAVGTVQEALTVSAPPPDGALVDPGIGDDALGGIAYAREMRRRGAPTRCACVTAQPLARVIPIARAAGLHPVVEKGALADDESILRLVASVAPVAGVEQLDALAGSSRAIRDVRALVLRYAAREQNVLVVGETGTGKELVARALHACSQRGGPLVAINVAAVPDTLFESALFGHARGAFTDARGERAGALEEAGEGTIVLDEIGDASAAAQAKLLRAIESRKFARVGETRVRDLRARVVALTNARIEERVRDGRFRLDLAQRLGVFVIRVPPLRERIADVAEIAIGMLLSGCERRELDAGAIETLMAHAWPGNVRELGGVMARVGAMAADLEDDACIGRDLVARSIAEGIAFDAVNDEGGGEGTLADRAGAIVRRMQGPLKARMESVHVAAIRQEVEACAGNRREAARILRADHMRVNRRVKG